MDSCSLTELTLIRILLKWKYIQDQNYAILAVCCNSEAILFKKFRPGHRAGVFIWENFHPGYRDLGRKNRDMNTSINIQRKEWQAPRSRKLSQPGRPARAHVKRPSVCTRDHDGACTFRPFDFHPIMEIEN